MESHDIYSLSEKVFGMIATGRRSADGYDPDWFAPPFCDYVRILRKKGKTLEDVLISTKKEDHVQNAIHSVAKLNGLGEGDTYDKMLIKASERFQLSKKLTKIADALERNEDIDLLPVHGQLTSIVAGQATGLVPANIVDYKSYKPFKACGIDYIDSVLGGIPSDGPIIVYGVQGTGKSHFSELMLSSWLEKYKKDTGAIYTLEMSAEHFLWRATKMYPKMESILQSGRLLVSSAIRTVDELIAEVQTKNLSFIALDDMDRIVHSQSPEEYQRAYLRLADICRFLKIPILILAQPNREAKLAIQRGERFLSPYDISWSSGAENAAALLVGLQRANNLDMVTKDSKGNYVEPMFPLEDDDREFLIFWKSRDGWPGDYDMKKQIGPGCIRLEKSKGDKMWQGKPFMNRLIPPNYKPKKERTGK